MALEPATMDPLEGPFNLDELRMWVSDTRKIASGKSFQVVRLGDLFDELLFGDAEKFELLVGNILDAKKHYRFRADLTDDLSISVINLPNGKMIMGVVNPVKKDAKFLINGHPVVIDAVKPTMVIGLQYKDDLDNTGRGLFIVSQASDTIEPPKILIEPQGGTFLEGDVADVIATAIGYKDVIAIKNGDVLDGIKAAALPVPILPGTSDIYVFGFVHPKDPNMIAWTKPASIRRGEAEPAQIISQSQSMSVDAGAETTLFADVIGTPPPLIKWVEKINGINGPVVATGREFTTKVLNTRTFVPIAVNRYKVGADGKFDSNGVLKDFPDEGDAVTVTKVGLPQSAPLVTADDATPLSTLYHTLALGETLDMFEGTLEASVASPALETLTLKDGKVVLTVGDTALPANSAGIRYKETLTQNASPWATNSSAYTPLVSPFTYFTPSDKVNINGNTITVQPAWGVGGNKLLPRTPGAYLEGTIRFNLKVSPPLLVLDDTSDPENTEANQKYAVGAVAPGSGYDPSNGNAVFVKIIDGTTSDNGVFDFTDGDKVRFEVISVNGVIKLALKHYHAGEWITNEVVDYPVALKIKALGGYGDAGGTLAVVYSGFILP